jgi:enoyl-CoA hydratase/carnithine racemase
MSSLPGLEDLTVFRIELAEGVATVFMDRAPVNAQNGVFRDEVMRVFDVLHDSDEVRAIVLTGAGKTFSAGADLRDRPDVSKRGSYPRHSRAVRGGFDCVMECRKPVIAAVNGAAIGAGCVLALVCDIVLVAEDAFMAMTEVDVGLAGGVKHVLRHFGQSDARMFLMTARRLYGPDLYRMNVASGCLPKADLLPAAQAMAKEIAGKVPLAVEAAKRAFTLNEYMPLHEGYVYEQTQTAALAKTEDTKEALAAFAEKRKPVFKGR